MAKPARHPARFILPLLALGGAGSVGAGQVGEASLGAGWFAQTPAVDPLRPIDAGVADRGPLSRSQRVVPFDLRAPSGFDRVYAVETAEGFAYERRSGALRAVFDQSVYVAGAFGPTPVIPPGTVFKIGADPVWMTAGYAPTPATRSAYARQYLAAPLASGAAERPWTRAVRDAVPLPPAPATDGDEAMIDRDRDAALELASVELRAQGVRTAVLLRLAATNPTR